VPKPAFAPTLGAFVQSYGPSALDASALLIPLVGFPPHGDARIAVTAAAIERRLMVDGLIRRYDTRRASDRQAREEGAFWASGGD
jgi:GH15 family glucan-1,4-alpha-glucosidase